MTPTDHSRDHVLYIGGTPLPQSQRDALCAIGVDVACLTAEEVEAGLRDEAARPALRQRIASAQYCVLGQGAGTRVITAILRQREGVTAFTWVTSREGKGIAEGMGLGGVDAESGLHVFVGEDDLFRTLRGLGEQQQPAAMPLLGHIVRPPLPAPYLVDPSAYTIGVSGDHWDAWYERLRQGYYSPHEILTGDVVVSTDRDEAFGVLEYVINHTPIEELDLLSAPRVRDWWAAAHATAGHQPLIALLATALARDGGRQTLAALPETMGGMRAGVEESWSGVVERAAERLALECVSATDCHGADPESIEDVARKWPMVPCDDPLGQGTDPAMFRPTLTTLRVARRYRSAPEVLREAYDRWGGRPYQQVHAREQLGRFVREAYPTSAEEVVEWERLLLGLPEGRFRKQISESIRWGWPRCEIPIANALGDKAPPERIPCVSELGAMRPVLFTRITSPGLRASIQSWIDRVASRHTRRVP